MTRPPASAPDRRRLLSLASAATLRARPVPYIGDTNTIRLDRIPASDARTLQRIYTFLQEVRARVEPRLDAPADALAALGQTLDLDTVGAVTRSVAELGAHLRSEEVPRAVRKAYHDVRGGSLMAVLMHLELVLEDEAELHDAERIFLLCRDHLKMMRNAVCDLDPEAYAADLAERDHGIDLLREKWTGVTYRIPGRSVRVELVCDFEGSISQRCMEFSALDRVVYNLVNNAARYTADGTVQLHVFAVDDAEETHLRFAVLNRVAPEHRAALLERFGDGGLGRLFEGGFTTGGHGIGMRICADFVTHGYGLTGVREAIADGYLGIELLDDHFVAWFHWPARRGDVSAAA